MNITETNFHKLKDDGVRDDANNNMNNTSLDDD